MWEVEHDCLRRADPFLHRHRIGALDQECSELAASWLVA